MKTIRYPWLQGLRRPVLVVMLLTAAGVTAADARFSDDAVMRQAADALVEEFLRVHNCRDGIEFVGGPFNLADYRKEDLFADYAERYVHYTYRRPSGIAGDPDTIRVRVTRGSYFSAAGHMTPESCRTRSTASDAARRAREDQRQARIPVPRNHQIQGPEDAVAEAVQMVYKDGWQLTRDAPLPVNVRRCEIIGSDVCVVYYGRSFRDANVFHYYSDCTVDRATRRPSYYDYSDAGESITGGTVRLTQQRFLLYQWDGTVSDEELIALAGVLDGIAPGVGISAVIASKESMEVSFGQLRPDFPFGSIAHAEPIARVTYRMREGTWEPMDLAVIERVVPSYDSPPLTLLFRPEVPVSSGMVRKHLVWDEWEEGLVASHLTDQDLCEIYRIAVRCRLFPPFRWVSLEMRDPEGVYVWPQSGDFVPRYLYLCKVKGQWRIDWDSPP